MKNGLGFFGACLLAFAAGCVVSFFTLPLWVTILINAAKDGPPTDWLGFAGGILGNVLTAIVASVAILFAWKGIRRQLRVSIVIREEDRLESQLPGLREASQEAEKFLIAIRRASAAGGTDPLNMIFKSETGRMSVTSKFFTPPALGNVHDVTRREFHRLMGEVELDYLGLSDAAEVESVWDDFFASIDNFERFNLSLKQRIERAEKLLPQLRAEIEHYFAQRD